MGTTRVDFFLVTMVDAPGRMTEDERHNAVIIPTVLFAVIMFFYVLWSHLVRRHKDKDLVALGSILEARDMERLALRKKKKAERAKRRAQRAAHRAAAANEYSSVASTGGTATGSSGSSGSSGSGSSISASASGTGTSGSSASASSA